jgi:hypothetical protein
MSAFSALNIVGNTHLSRRDRFTMSLVAPLMYLGFYVVTAVEYLVVLQLIVKFHRLPASVSRDQVTWVSPGRSGAAAVCT